LSAHDVALMPLGDHLEDLRRRLSLGLLGLVVPLVLTLTFWRQIFEFFFAPANRALLSKGLAPAFQVTTFFEMFNSALKLSFILSLLVAGPWLLYQLWLFVAPGLYQHERRFAYLLGPLSLTLTICSALFMYYLMLPVVLAFFVEFNSSLKLKTPPPAPMPAGIVLPTVPTLEADPPDPPAGSMWINAGLHQLRIAVAPLAVAEVAGTGAAGEQKKPAGPRVMGIWLSGNEMISQQYRVADYVSMLFGFGIAFAAGFQMPVAVLLLGWANIVNVKFLSKYRRHAIMACAILGAVLTPADPISMMVLAIPLYVLYELGVVLLWWLPASRVAGDRGVRPAEAGRGESQDEPPDA
jgi:sec-independent protein translocase protein TatC